MIPLGGAVNNALSREGLGKRSIYICYSYSTLCSKQKWEHEIVFSERNRGIYEGGNYL